MNAVLSAKPTRQVQYRTRGQRQAWFNRLVSPSGLGERIKPFVFLDDFDIAPSGKPLSGLHPHSGIATLTVITSGQMEYIDTTGKTGILPTGGVEWMNAGGGVWHGGGAIGNTNVRGFQLWVALPPEDENGPSYSQYLAPETVPAVGPVRVILGSYGGASSAIHTRASMNYLHVRLKDGEAWRYQPPAGHSVAWVSPMRGVLHTAAARIENEIAVFEEGEGAINFIALGDTEFVLGSAVPHPHDLVLGYYSVHTSQPALDRGEAGIETIRKQLEAQQ